MKKKYSIAMMVAMACGNLCTAVHAEEELGTIDVFGVNDSVIDKKVGETVTTSEQLDKQQVQDSRDLVRYETGISVVEKGRMGASGYAMRGVEENRVNITVDGLQQAEVIASQGFKELFEGYGNFNNTRNGVEFETLKQVTIARGADSTKVGSGALGGAVIFETKDARDYLTEKDWHIGTKIGYASQNTELVKSQTFAGRFKDFDALLVYTDRDGNEIQNWGYDKYPDIPELGSQGRARQKTDPYTIEKKSTLFKLSYNPNETNRITLMYDDFKNRSKGTDWSYTLAPLQTDRDKSELESRHTFDTSERRNLAFTYENYDENPLWDTMKLSVSRQKISQVARTDEYCDGLDKCKGVSNPLGLQMKDGKIVDKEGKELTFKEVPKWEWDADYQGKHKSATETTLALVDSEGNEYLVPSTETNDAGEPLPKDQVAVWNTNSNNEMWIDCSKSDCDGTVTFYHMKASLWTGAKFIDDDHDNKVVIDLNNVGETTQDDNGEITKFTVKEIKGDKGHWKHVSSGDGGWGSDYMLLKPDSKGYSTNWWKKRSLDSELDQIKLDLTKNFETKNIEHNVSYGLMWSQLDKSMINESGIQPYNLKWWGNSYFSGINDDGSLDCSGWGTNCPQTDKPSTFLLPVITKTGSFNISDNIRFNDKFSLDASYRYDRISHKPYYDADKDPAIPGGILRGMYVKQRVLTKPEEPRTWNYNCTWGVPCTDPAYINDKAKYEKDLDDYENNPQKNIDYLVNRKRTFTQHSYALAATYDPVDNLRVQAKYSKGFRAPTSDELYFTFKHPDFTIVANPDLDPEIAKTKEISFTLHNDKSYITLSGFRTDYDNFIDLNFRGYKQFTAANGQTNGIPYRLYQNVNNSEAYVKGFRVESKLDLAELSGKLNGFNVGYKFEYQKGKTLGIDTDASGNEKQIWHAINAIDPAKHVFSIGYTDPADKFGVDLFLTYVTKKKAKDTYNAYHAADKGLYGSDEGLAARHLSKSYNVFDMVGYYKPIKGMTIRAGIYNVFDKKYSTWSSQRAIRSFGTSNMVCKKPNAVLGCQSANQGSERFDAPGRNFKIGLEYVF
ncbi:MAG: TonB-dependent hemoglobin/transferrin/lactoferrin family receptor [Gammaproteobacteria bacterium]|nr:TonB-dependent hemoglobin/transferrin/lactoferrin family receptor [Gammaproteobacteria bacterium]